MKRLMRGIGLSLALSVASATLAMAQNAEGWKQEGPKRLSAPRLNYPDSLRLAGAEGVVLVAAVIDTTGRANPLRVLKSPDFRLNDAAKEFVAGSYYRPATINGKAVEMVVQVPVAFKLNRMW